ncbi:gas vesicle protein GvpG [Halogeometricum limi]|uniref:Gas vesicle protein G n=1 Tax=Halogeometricum limi TaxID=555875 RepID=A0A1I6GUG7_9EURY|nr:gas vesicle protein GvpG [Halogeometricum limi]SFR45766.1 Gas vesicle protein G [Halogeometricum limi]
MFLLDDILLWPIRNVVDVLHSLAVQEMYDPESIQSDIKETQLLYELGELDDAEYEERRARLEAELDAAERARERLSDKVVVQR